MTTFRWYLLGIVLLFGGYVALEYYRPKPLDWSPSLRNDHKIPYGTYVLYDVLPQVLGTDSVSAVRQPIYNQLLADDEPGEAEMADATETTTDSVAADSAALRMSRAVRQANAAAEATTATQPLVSGRASYLFVNQAFEASKLETVALLRFVAAGHDVFIAAEDFDNNRGHLGDTLGVEATAPEPTRLGQVIQDSQRGTDADSVELHLLRTPAGQPGRFRFGASAARYRVQLRRQPGRRGATLAADAQGHPVLVRLDYGRGHFYLCSVPLALGNVYVLRPGTSDFAFAALSYLPTGRPVWWDEYQKQGRLGERSLLRVVMSNPALQAAYWLLLVTGLLFVLVEARRRQRVIPELPPLPNTSLLFTRTVAGLYRQGRNHAQIAEKKIALFLGYLRARFQENPDDLADEDFRARLSQKAGLPRERIDELLRQVGHTRTAPAVSDQQLLRLSRTLREFRRDAQ